MINESVAWNPWHGCKKCSPGCQNCFVFQMDKRYGRDTNTIAKVKTNFNLPVKKDRQRNYKHPAGTLFKLCFTSDFFIEEADIWRSECWDMIRERSDCHFILTTKRADRMYKCLPLDWGKGWDNVTFAVSCENQEKADERIRWLMALPAKHRYVFLSPILEYINLNELLDFNLIDRVCVGGESYSNARLCDFNWIKQIYEDCKAHNIEFDFHQTGSNFLYNGNIIGGGLKQQQEKAEELEKRLKGNGSNCNL